MCMCANGVAFDALRLVEFIVNHRKLGKAAGLDKLSTEHLLCSLPVIFTALSRLFNLVIRVGHIPNDFGYSYTVPILKLAVKYHQ